MDAYCDEWEAMWTSEADKPDWMKNNGTKNGTDGNSTDSGSDSGDGKDTPKSAKSAVPKGDDNKNADKAEEKSDAKAGEGSLPSELTKGAPAAEPAKDTEKKEEAAPSGDLPKELTKGSEPAKEEAKAAVQSSTPNSDDSVMDLEAEKATLAPSDSESEATVAAQVVKAAHKGQDLA